MDRIVSPNTAPLESATLQSTVAENGAQWCLRLTRLSFGATVVLIPFRMRQYLAERPIPPIYHDYTDLLIFASDLFLLATLALWLSSLVLQPRRVRMGPWFLSVPIVGLAALAALSTFSSVDPTASLYHVVRLLFLGALYLYVVNEVRFDQLILPVALQILIQAVVGIAQVLQQHSLGLDTLQELALDPSWSGVSIVLADGVRSLRAYGLTDHPNILGGCFAFGLLWVGAWYAGTHTRWHTVVTAVLALGALGLLLTFSRSAWVAFASGLGFCLFMLWRTHQHEMLARWALPGAAALILLSPFVWHNLPYLGVRLNANDAFAQVALEDRSLSERDNLALAALQIWSEHPLTGIGVGALPQAERIQYPDPNEFGANYQPAHFVLLEVAAEMGILGGALYFVVILAPWLALWWNRKRLLWKPALIGISGVLLAITVVGFFDYYTWLLAPGQLWQWLVWGVWGSLYLNSFIKVTPRHARGRLLAIGANHA